MVEYNQTKEINKYASQDLEPQSIERRPFLGQYCCLDQKRKSRHSWSAGSYVFNDQITSSFNMRHKANPGYASAVVDMLFTSSDVKIVSKSVPEDDVSDHKPLLATIEI